MELTSKIFLKASVYIYYLQNIFISNKNLNFYNQITQDFSQKIFFLILRTLEFCVRLKTWFLDLHQEKVICFRTKLNNIIKLLCNISRNDTKCIFYEHDKKLIKYFAEKKCFIVLTPPITLKLFLGKCLSIVLNNHEKYIFLSFKDFFTHQFADIVQ